MSGTGSFFDLLPEKKLNQWEHKIMAKRVTFEEEFCFLMAAFLNKLQLVCLLTIETSVDCRWMLKGSNFIIHSD